MLKLYRAEIDAAVVVSVGPGDEDVRRMAQLLQSLWQHEPAGTIAVLVDDSPSPRCLESVAPPPAGSRVVSIPNPRFGEGWSEQGGGCAATLAGLGYVQSATRAPLVVKLETDALVIAPFIGRARELVQSEPNAGLLGSYRTAPDGSKRDWSHWARRINELNRPLLFGAARRRAGRRFPFALFGRDREIRRQLSLAMANGYEAGENVHGGAYLLTRPALDVMSRLGLLTDPLAWLHAPISEDVLVSMLTRATGYEIRGDSAEGGLFGVRHIGLPDTPANLQQQGYAFIHSIKNDRTFREREIVEFFRQTAPSRQRIAA